MLVNCSDNSDTFVEARLNLIKFAVELSKRLTTFALLEEIIELQGQFCYSEAELQKYDNNILILKCQLLYKKLAEHSIDLADYEITESKLAYFKRTIESLEYILHQESSCTERLPEKLVIPQ
jgi:hypothetical protein